MMKNDVGLVALSVPLVVREITPGSFITSLTMSYGDRLPETPGAPLSLLIVWKYTYPVEDGTCMNGQPGGFGSIAPLDYVSPDGVMFSRVGMPGLDDLAPGADVTGSMILTVDLTATPGQFEIDTTCMDPGYHIQFGEVPSGLPVTPEFGKGVITISSCSCPNQSDIEPDGFITPLDLAAIIDILFASATDIQDPNCPSPRFDFDCDSFTTPLDLSGIIDYLYVSGPGPCDPCAP
jgi:hypothetical protein